MASSTPIQVKAQTRDALREMGSMEDDYNSVIEKLIIEHNRNSFLENSRKIVTDRKEEFINVDEI
ncbi:hypothetical protein [Methanohalophilus portucalensis]|uniref:Uncharacterized protein n=2 Tax=Methanohalophilus portucalensis TaxID=39664 RepID=A0A1L9C1L9_9EURY|nr:hypothetical protein [Methanohalophilus portucalensis]ATU09113.1 hypothetical protein BKM01_10270 [Methanohalophilus portucalensis]OJH48412.1 hypothetical protein MPF_2015 [Methanohalophilus portucalensis FDF-1]RNI08570.1 hypothetical protein EFE41_10395 [Methanohalophilus portucalensis FDF-1]SMH44797.1 hypothetical protein SAMN06264941_2109 [Methanohalophilus portucalensis FDF-1]